MLTLAVPAGLLAEESRVTPLRTPTRGLQPEVVIDASGNVSLLYFSGDPAAGDLFFTRRAAGADDFAPAVRVNDQQGAAVATGTIRGGHLAVGRNGEIHVAWMGSKRTWPAPDDHHSAPLLYARSVDGGGSFEPARNMITAAYGLDGGGSVAADRLGNVHVVWHAPAKPGAEGEENRVVWVVSSADSGGSFGAEHQAWEEKTGVCGCCGLRSFAPADGGLMLLYRAATRQTERDMYLLHADAGGFSVPLSGKKISGWSVRKCPMSSASFTAGRDRVGVAWESQDKVYFEVLDAPGKKSIAGPIENPKNGNPPQKHPSVAFDDSGNVLLVWTVGRGWGSASTVLWRIFTPDGKPTEQTGEQAGVPPWSKAAAAFHPVDGFLVFY